MPGIDRFSPGCGGFGRPQVRLPFRADDGAVILLEYRRLVQATPAFNAAVAADRATARDDQDMRMARFFETASARHRWLTQSLFLARGRLLGARRIAWDVCRVG